MTKKNGTKNRQTRFGFVGTVISIIIVALVGALVYVGYKNFIAKDKDKPIQFGDYGYILNGKKFPPLVRGASYIPAGLSDQEGADYLAKYSRVPGLSDALNKIAKDNPCSITEGRHKLIVLGVTKDKTQALIGNGCGGTGYLRNFLIKRDGTWTAVGALGGQSSSQADEADMNVLLDVPNCILVSKFNIEKSIAPICFTKKPGDGNLFAGDSGNYKYIVR